MKIRTTTNLFVALAVTVVGLGALANAASATEPTNPATPRTSCPGVQGWRVNPDESALMPTMDEKGVHFTLSNNNGKGLLKRDIDPVKIAELPALTMTAKVKTGVAPLIKAETSDPYSTINFKADGTMWSSKIPSGQGSQNQPVADRATLAALAPYTADTRVRTVGFGYANDTGNEATVTKFSMGHKTWVLKCKPEATAGPSATASASPTAVPTSPATTKPATNGPTVRPSGTRAPELAVTPGGGGPTVWLLGGLLAAAGAAALFGLVVWQRRRAPRFEA